MLTPREKHMQWKNSLACGSCAKKLFYCSQWQNTCECASRFKCFIFPQNPGRYQWWPIQGRGGRQGRASFSCNSRGKLTKILCWRLILGISVSRGRILDRPLTDSERWCQDDLFTAIQKNYIFDVNIYNSMVILLPLIVLGHGRLRNNQNYPDYPGPRTIPVYSPPLMGSSQVSSFF